MAFDTNGDYSDDDRAAMTRMLAQPRAGIQAPVDPATAGVQPPPAPAPAPDLAPMPAPGPAPVQSRLNGYEPSKMTAEHAQKSPKYAFGMLAQEFADNPDGLKAMSQDPRFAAAGFQYVGKDKIMAPDPDNGGRMGLVDVGLGFSDGGGRGWQWGAEGGPGQAGAPPEQQAQMPTSSYPGQDPYSIGDLADPAFFAELMRKLKEEGGAGADMDRAGMESLWR